LPISKDPAVKEDSELGANEISLALLLVYPNMKLKFELNERI
jgi:hypothetical protein